MSKHKDGDMPIPDAIMKAANECVAQFRWNNDESWHLFVARSLVEERQTTEDRITGLLKDPAAVRLNWMRGGIAIDNIIAEKVLAERQRCAEIIETRLPLYTDIGQINALRECVNSIRSLTPSTVKTEGE